MKQQKSKKEIALATFLLILSIFFYSVFQLTKKKKENSEYQRPQNICEICNGTGNAISPRTIDRTSHNKYKCRACNGTGFIK